MDEHTRLPGGSALLPLVSVLVPAYNEADGLPTTLPALWHHLGGLSDMYRFELIIVDDGSTDATRHIAETFAAHHQGVRVLSHDGNRKLGGALRTGVPATLGDIIITYDADQTYSLDHIDRMLEAMADTGAQVVVASPYMRGGQSLGVPRKLLIRSRVANAWLSLASPQGIATLTGMVRAYDGPWLRTVALKSEDVDVNVEILYKAQLLRASIVEIPARLDWTGMAERSGRSRLMARRGRWNTYKSLVAGFIFRPFLFFAVPALFFVVLGASLLARKRGDRADMVGVASTFMGIQMAFGALNALQSKRYYEELFNQGTVLARLQLQRRYQFRGGDDRRQPPAVG